MRDVTIKPALNGYLVRLGCQRVVFTDRAQMLRALGDYMENPREVERMYLENSCNSKQLGFIADDNRTTLGDQDICPPTERDYPDTSAVTNSSYED